MDIYTLIDFLIELQGSQTALLIMASFLGVTIAVLMSSRDEWVRMLTLGLMGLGTFTAAYRAEIIFADLNLKLYQTFNISLSAEFLGGVITIILFNYWDDIEDTLSTYVLMVTMLLFGLGLVQYDGEMFGLPPGERVFMEDFSSNAGVEIICAILLFLVFFKLKWLLYLSNEDTKNKRREFRIGIIGLILIGIMGFLALWVESPLYVGLGHDDLLFALSGAFMTSLILGSWVTSEEFLFLPITMLTIIAVSWLLINYAFVGIDVSVSISAELLGALIATVLTERHWLWNTREFRKISLVG